MKLTTLFLVSALIFLFTSPSLSSRTTLETGIVYDFQGNPLLRGTSYIIMGVDGGRLDVATSVANNETCEQYVTQLPNLSLLIGDQFTFTPITNPIGEDRIKLAAPLAIQSSIPNPCAESSILRVSSATGIPVPILTTGGYFNTPNSCLRIRAPDFANLPNVYLLEHCPNSCGAAEKRCYEVGIYQTEHYRHLSTQGNELLRVRFIKRSSVDMV